MARKITFDSVKLPRHLDEFINKNNGENLMDVIIKLSTTLQQPQHHLNVNGYIRDCCTQEPKIYRSEAKYKMERCLSRSKLGRDLNLKKVLSSLQKIAEINNLNMQRVSIKKARFLIHNKVYEFKYHAPAQALVLKTINKKEVGRLNQVKIEALLCKGGDLEFCAPSHCTKQYFEKWVCE
jgi:hypothetical protein